MSGANSRTVRRAQAGTTEAPWVRYTLITLALAFMLLFLVLPLAAAVSYTHLTLPTIYSV